MSNVTDFISGLETPQNQIMTVLHQLIMANGLISAKIRYRVPFYYQKSWVCYLNPVKNNGVELCFIRANELSNDNGWLDFRKRKQVAGISYFSIDDIDEKVVNQTLQEALLLDETVKYNVKRKK